MAAECNFHSFTHNVPPISVKGGAGDRLTDCQSEERGAAVLAVRSAGLVRRQLLAVCYILCH